MELRYDITAVGEQQLRAVIRGIESELIASNKRMTSAIRGTGAAGGRPRALGAGRSGADLAIKEAEKTARTTAAIAIREDKRVWAEKERNVRRFAQIEIRAIEQADRARARSLEMMVKGAGRTVGRSVMGVARAGAGAASLAGGIAIGSALHDQMQVQAYASRVANQGERPDLKGDLATGSQKLAGFTGEESLSALDKFVQKSGDLKAGIAAWQMMGKVSLATSSDITEVGEAAGAAYNSIAQDTKDPVERLKILSEVMKTLAVQGNMGSVEMRDFAVELPKLAAASRRFGGDSGSSLKMMGALTQLAVKKGGATDAAEAATSVMRFTDDLIRDAKSKKGKPGLDVFTDKTNTHLRAPGDIISDIMDKTGGDLTKIGGLFGMRGMKALSGVSPAYLDAFNAAEANKKGTGKAAGRAAVNSALGQFSGASLSDGDLDKRAQLRLDDPDLQVKEAVKAFNVAIGTQLMPAMTKLIPQFTALVPTVTSLASQLTGFVEFLASNPLAGIGAVVSAKVAADVSGALIGEALKKAITTQIGQAGGLVVGVAAITVGVMNLIQASKEIDANRRSDAMNANAEEIRGSAAQELAANGQLSPETRLRLEKLRARESERISDNGDPLAGVGTGRRTLNTFTGGLTGPTIYDDRHVQKTVDQGRAQEVIHSEQDADRMLIMDSAAKGLLSASTKLASAADKLAASGDATRTKPIVARN